jgi:hypothetical protein
MIYFLHFDINKVDLPLSFLYITLFISNKLPNSQTIIMQDPAAKVSLPAMLNSILSECVWGFINLSNDLDPSSKDLPLDSWTVVSSVPSRDPPTGNLLSYGEFLETRTKLSRLERKALKTTFTEPGNIGERFRNHFDQLVRHMSEKVFIMPAFYRLISTLHEREIEFRIIFRTFGTDAVEVAEEYNSFCTNQHPRLTHQFDLSHRSLLPTSFAKLSRTPSCVKLEALSPTLTTFGDSSSPPTLVPSGGVAGVKNIYEFLYRSLLSDSHAFSIQDDFSYWDSCGERFSFLFPSLHNSDSDESGKLLLIDSRHEDTEILQVSESCHPPHSAVILMATQIFFDDNIERDRAHIVDVRDVSCSREDGVPIPFPASRDKYLCRVAPLEIISDEDYFVKEFDRILSVRGAGLQTEGARGNM